MLEMSDFNIWHILGVNRLCFLEKKLFFIDFVAIKSNSKMYVSFFIYKLFEQQRKKNSENLRGISHTHTYLDI